MKYLALLFSILFTSIKSFSQTISVGDSYAEEITRMHQLLGVSDNSSSFSIRPLNVSQDSSVERLIAGKNILRKSVGFSAQLLPFNWLNEYNFNRPYGYNNSSLYPAAGFQSRISGGLFVKAGILHIQLKPEFVYAENKPFQTFAEVQANNSSPALLGSYFGIVNGIDAPERFGNSALQHLYPGQSKITIIFKNIEAGISTENMWWGPGIQNSIMMSNSAPGFLHWTFNSAAPVKTVVGTFEWQIIGGKLIQSGYLPLDTGKLVYGKGMFSPKPKVTRYISAFTVNWQPRWIEGLFIGGSAYDYLDKDSSYSARNIFRKLIPVITGSSVAANAITNTSNGDGQDFAYALNVRQVLNKYNAEIYFEWARNDRAGNLIDFLQQPEHSSAYTLGGARIFELTKKQLFQIRFELTHLQNSPTFLLRDEPTWYVHSVAPRDGYTNDGRYIGAGIGPGSNSLMFDFSLLNGMNCYGMKIERLVHNNDLYYYAFMGTKIYNRQWVDLSDAFYANFKFKKYLVSAELTPIYTLNYEYAGGASYNFNTSINLTYYFD